LRLQGAGRLGDSRKELRLLCESLRQVHQLMITRGAAVCRNDVESTKEARVTVSKVRRERRLPLDVSGPFLTFPDNGTHSA
jgi:hypothetical protein